MPLPWESLQLPRQPLNPITAAAFGLGYVLRLWRDAPPLVEGGTVVLLHPFSRVMGTRAQAPYRTLFAALRDGPAGARLGGAEAVAARDRRALSAYRGGSAPHPRLPFAEWEACAPVLERAGRVIVAAAATPRPRARSGSSRRTAPRPRSRWRRDRGRRGAHGVVLGPPYPGIVVGGEA